VTIGIKDEGPGFDTSAIKKQIEKLDILSNRGRGIFIICQLCSLSWNEKGNEVNLRIKRKPGAAE
jgi:anti-sigma regulatory factor (Ser/Thr protein kinase)